ncbi:PREDICTED: olfactory receptor 1019-like [Nanorana parkeri]|uniref:olfactory receptor 1019-like n=1 Tax=Nanorana parkeri TaxID=125878 RepID=UPI000854259B|nr:PREDICTED: olfactory receptor 1019-like [Nanorana parkeri]
MLSLNKSSIVEFIFTGLTDKSALNIPLFVIFVHVYIITVVGNVGIITLGMVDKSLHKPMYLFLCNLSFADLAYSSAVTPKMLNDFLCETKVISFVGCAMQMYIFVSFATIECLLLGVMAYDRYVAICSPLLYQILMSSILCLRMVIAAYFGGFMTALVHTIGVFHLNFCRSNTIDHFFCDIPPLYKLSCSDITINLAILVILGGLVTMSCLILILASYINIILAIMKIRSAQGRYKAFNTCASHMTAVSVFYGTVLFMYFRPSTSYALQQDRVASVFYSIVIPMLNPLIYSLRNTEVKEALKSSLKCSKEY